MTTKTSLQRSSILMGAMLVLLAYFSITKAGAQVSYSGDNAICYNSSGTATNCSIQTYSPAFIDASVFSGGTTNDVCLQIRSALANLPHGTVGAVIDARGATPPGSGYTFSCANGTPWWGGSGSPITTPAEILLPAGQINITEPWVLPSGTRVMGAGVFGGATENGVPVTANGYGTTLRACDISVGPPTCNLVAGNPIVQFGGTDKHGNNFCTACMGISAEYLTLDGADNSTPNSFPQNLVGILNQNAQNGSYVDQVTITYIGGLVSDIGLQIGPAPCSVGCSVSAVNSGPYTNIFFTGKGSESTCVAIYQSGTLGLHGITCTGNGSSAPAIYLDASNTTIEDAHIEDSSEGVVVGGLPSGSAQPAASDTLINISAGGKIKQLTNIVHICGATPPSGGTGSCAEWNTVSDLSLVGIANPQSQMYLAMNTIQDDVTATLIPSTANFYGVGLYGAGESFASGYTRFSTSPYISSSGPNPVPSWGVGYGAPGSTCPVGSIFTNTQGSSGGNYTLYVCDKSGTSSVWNPVL